MKKSYPLLILIVFATSIISSNLQAQSPRYSETVYRHKAKFPRIFRSGELASAVQLCDPKSVCLGTGLYIMEKASVGEVKKCKFYLYVVKDTIQSCRITTDDEGETEALYRQLVKEFGNPVEERTQGDAIKYKWPDQVRNGITVTTSLVVTGKSGEFRHWHDATLPDKTEK
jgi:hypothetical protein